MTSLPLSGVCSAILVPRHASGDLDVPSLLRLIEFLQERGIKSFAINGATGEYPRSSATEFLELVRSTRKFLGCASTLVVAAGGPDLRQVQELVDISSGEGADGILLPVPYYFPIRQDDIVAFVSGLRLELPTYLYNLPGFTTPLHPETVLQLCLSVLNIVGVKDSSGSLDIVSLLRERAPDAGRIIGNDSALHSALSQHVCHGVVSGVSGVLPELILALYQSGSVNSASEQTANLQTALTEFTRWLDIFPVPWGLKIAAQARGLFQAEFNLPLSPERKAKRAQFESWIEANQHHLLIV